MEISRSRIAANYRAVRDAVAPGAQDDIGVVKADAYGHGAVEIARILCREGAEWLAVSSVEEGVALGARASSCRILVMAGVMAWEPEAMREFRLTPVAHSLEDLRRFDKERARGPIDVHLKIDTGMDRLGTRASAAEIAAVVSGLRHTRLEGLMSHFASAADFYVAADGGTDPGFPRYVAALASMASARR